jgi:hypothetical protein
LTPFDAFNRASALVVAAITADGKAVVTLVFAEIADGKTDGGLAAVAKTADDTAMAGLSTADKTGDDTAVEGSVG